METKAADYEPGNYQATPKGILAGGGGGTPPSFVCGDKLIDDNYKYRTASKSGYCYMTQSLKRDSNHRRCYDDPGLCESNGGLYDYGHSDNICPTGWRLPSTDGTLFIQLADQSEEGFIGYFHSKEGIYKYDAKYLMTDDGSKVIDVVSASLVSVPWPDSAVSVRCIKDPS